MHHHPNLKRAPGILALALTLPAVGLAQKIDLDRITPVPANEPIPVADFFRPPILRSPTLNPSGTHIAAIIAAGEDHTSLMVCELKTKKIETLSTRGDSDIFSVRWLTDDRLVYGVSVGKAFGVSLSAARLGALQDSYPLLQNAGASLVDVPLHDRLHPLARMAPNTPNTGKYGEVVTLNAKLEWGALLNWTQDGGVSAENRDTAAEPIIETPDGFDLYYLADREGKLAFGVTSTNGVLTLHRLDGDKWETCPEDLDEMNLIGSGEKPGDIVVLGPRAGGKPRPLEFMDAATGKPGEVLLQDPGYDFDGWLYRDPVTRDIAGVVYDGVVPKVVWFSEAYRDLQKAVEHLFPGTDRIVRILGNDETGKGLLLVSTYSDRQPEIYHWVDLQNHTAGPIQSSRPWIDPKRMQAMGVIKYQTKDGRKLDAYITLPAGASKQNPAPLIVLPNSAIGARNVWGFNAEVQFFASRGYAVLQPNLRGSAGYQWMFPTEDEWAFRKMHDDVTEAVKTMLASGLVDRARVAIIGTADAGYLALSGAAYEPSLYRCAIGISPLCDWIKAIKENKYYQYSSPWYARTLRKLGDPDKDPAKFDGLAPLRHAEDIRAAVLIITGEFDPTYENMEAKEMASTLRRKGIPADSVYYLDEGGGVRHLNHLVDVYTRIESFLAENMGPAARPPAAAGTP